MAHERETWLDHGVAELLLRGRPVETADAHAQAQADRLARVLEDASRVAGADAEAGARTAEPSAELPGEAAALAAFRQAVGTVGRPARTDARAAGIGTVRLDPESGGARLPSFGRPLRLGLAAAMAGCALSGVAAGAGYLYAPSAGESPPRPANSVSDAVTPEPLVSETPSNSLNSPPLPSDTAGDDGTDLVSPGASGSDAGASGGATDKGKGGKDQSAGDGWKDGDGEKWYAKLVQACHEYRNGTIADSKKKLLEDAAKGPEGVSRFCGQLLNEDRGGDGHYEGGHGEGGDGGGDDDGTGGAGGEGPQHGGPAEGGTDGGTDGGSGGGTGGGSAGPPSEWPGDGDTIEMTPPDTDEASTPPPLPATPDSSPSPTPTPSATPAPSPSAS
ncbi:hypothetical protein ACIBLA_01375 [Streptomyces sp. NPDC050433]|uniref:hypothetical protein n=1 Tax=Streptomyces sp. NPDC050433 TaxID=3365615 RepID=UPI0037AF11BF